MPEKHVRKEISRIAARTIDELNCFRNDTLNLLSDVSDKSLVQWCVGGTLFELIFDSIDFEKH